MYDNQIARWQTPDPLVEGEYWYEFDKEYIQKLSDNNRDQLFMVVDALIRDFKAKKTYAS